MIAGSSRVLPSAHAESVMAACLDREEAAVKAWEGRTFDEAAALASGGLVLYGAGGVGRLALEALMRRGLAPLAYSDGDSKRWGSEVAGVPVLPPAVAAERFGAKAAFVVTIWNRSHRFEETRAVLAAIGCRCVVSCAALFYQYPEGCLPYYAMDLPHRLVREATNIRKAFSLWNDEESRREFLNELRWRMDLDFSGILPRPAAEQYFAVDLFRLGREEVFIDCGAYDGDTLKPFLALTGGCFQRVIAYEPDPRNHGRLKSYRNELPAKIAAKIDIQRAAVGARREILRFNADGLESSALDPAGGKVVESRPLDDWLGAIRPTYIKMDIEGAELDALQGGERLIRESSPTLAVCVYHRPSHFWEIPLWLAALPCGYRLYLRRYAEVPWDLVCYAVPVDREAPP